MMSIRSLSPLIGVLSLILLSGCVSETLKSTSIPSVKGSPEIIPEDRLLDIGIAIFNPGEIEEDSETVFPEVRQAESRYMPFVLMEAIQDSAAWGAVRVIPDSEQAVDVTVQTTILHSDGEMLTLFVHAHDSTGRQWLNQE